MYNNLVAFGAHAVHHACDHVCDLVHTGLYTGTVPALVREAIIISIRTALDSMI